MAPFFQIISNEGSTCEWTGEDMQGKLIAERVNKEMITVSLSAVWFNFSKRFDTANQRHGHNRAGAMRHAVKAAGKKHGTSASRKPWRMS